MNQVESFLRKAKEVLDAAGIRHALVGGFAVMVRCQPRFTRDADLVVAVADDAEAEAVVRRMTGIGLRIGGVLEQTSQGRLATVRLTPPDAEDAVLDVLFASSGIEREIVAGAEVLEIIPGLALPVASVSALIALKVLAEAPRRPQDRSDLLWLVEAATPDQMAEARRFLGLIEQRGFHRD